MSEIIEGTGTMGTNGVINITKEMMTKAKNAIATYKEAVGTAYNSVSSEMGKLNNNTFLGSAGDGFHTFYNNNIDPMLKSDGSLIKMLESLDGICDSILKQIPDENGVDESLGQMNNQNSGSENQG